MKTNTQTGLPANITHVQNQSAPAFTQEAGQGSFFDTVSPFFQAKLSIGASDDPYEREADQVADTVMGEPASGTDFFSPVITGIQRKCDHCAEEEKLQRKEESHTPPNIQRDLIDCGMFSKKEETMDAEEEAADAAEAGTTATAADPPDSGADADSGGEGTIQKKCAHCEKEEDTVQRQEEGGPESASPSLESGLNSSRGGGSPLPDTIRSFMEERFDTSFNDVRVHNDASATEMSSSINAHAFTHGPDIYFNSGKYAPDSDGGKRLLAHELTHVVQQSGGQVQRKRNISPATAKPAIQRSFYFAPTSKPPGSLIHSTLLPLFNAANADLFTEVKIPGANKKDVDKGKWGVADFYRATPSRTIAIKFDKEPAFLTRDTDFRASNTTYDHNRDAAPAGTTKSPRVHKLDVAPTTIEIGDLKPGAASGESILGGSQVGNYITGINNTKDSINNYLTTSPGESNSATKNWGVTPSPMSSMTIPTDLQYTVGNSIRGMQSRDLSLFREGDKKAYVPHVGMQGSLFVYKDRPPGVWSYEWIPDTVPATTGSPEVNTVIDRLNGDVIPGLTATGGVSIQPKRITPRPPLIMRKDEKFSNENWKKKHYNKWKTDATKVLKNKGEVKKAEVAVGLVDVEKRSGKKITGMSQDVRDKGTGLAKVKHWKRFGGFYGWLREKFDFLFIKIKSVVDKVKKKVQDFAKKGGGGTPGDWFKAFAQVVFKIFKMVGTWVVTQVMDKLLNSLKQGVIKNMQSLFMSLLPEDAKKHLAKFCELKEKYSKILDAKEDDIIKMLFGDKLDLFDKIAALEEKISMVADVVTIIKWGIRLLACASPPAIGCLWNLVLEALMYLLAKLMSTCWFTKEVYAPVLNKVKFLKDFPAEVASVVVTQANEILPVPEGLEKWFQPIVINADEFKVECNETADGSGKLTEERRAILDIVKEEGGEEKLLAALEMMNKRGAGPWVLLTKERLEMLKKAMEKASPDEMKAAAADKEKPIPSGMEEITADIAKYTGAEKKLIGEATEAKRVAGEKKALAEAEKEVDAIMKEEKVKEALAKPYPSYSQLKKDVANNQISWDKLAKYSVVTINIDGRSVLLMKTGSGSRLGAYYKFAEFAIKGNKKQRILDVSEFYTLDAVPEDDNIAFVSAKPGSTGYFFESIPAMAKNTLNAVEPGIFFGLPVNPAP